MVGDFTNAVDEDEFVNDDGNNDFMEEKSEKVPGSAQQGMAADEEVEDDISVCESDQDDFHQGGSNRMALHLQQHTQPPEQSRRQQTTDCSSRPLCSVLNTVIDHIMVPPCPMTPVLEEDSRAAAEPDSNDKSITNGRESAEKSVKKLEPPLLVPVLRIFGPLIRRDECNGQSTRLEPRQSACLYIHGAFPYMLARPVIAGPDGSLHRSCHKAGDALSPPRHVDWDCPDAVRRILPVLQQNLETALQETSMNAFGQQTGDATFKNHHNNLSAARPRFLRRLSVVMGRGFYTYSPGPAAPFLRVEYYDPSQHWKVKRILEIGLELPSFYHPDPVQYDAVIKLSAEKKDGDDEDEDSQQEEPEALQFHCYEAHIPHTMQFFKDWNLSGMSYVHVKDAKFRGPLPSHVRQRWKKNASTTDRQETTTPDPSQLFLESNTQDEYRWMTPTDNDEQEDNGNLSSTPNSYFEQLAMLQQQSGQSQFSSSCSSVVTSTPTRQNQPPESPPRSEWIESPPTSPNQQGLEPILMGGAWSKKETSCDLELDMVVTDILNIQDVMTALPDDPEEREQTHWRAVPSLREIWKQERRRMRKLLKPEDDFLSATARGEETATTTPPFTLNVKKGQGKPGARLAREHMKHLVNVSEGLEESFQRVMKDIVDRHGKDVSHVDRILRERRLGVTEQRSDDPSLNENLTPTDNEAVDALAALHNAFEGNDGGGDDKDGEGRDSQFSTSTPGRHPSLSMSQETKSSQNDSDRQSSRHIFHSQSSGGRLSSQQRSYFEEALTQEFSAQRSSSSQAVESPADAFELSQRIARGDRNYRNGRFRHVDDFIDPNTLTPYEVDDDADLSDLDEEEMERLATQTLMTGMKRPDHEAADSELDVESSAAPNGASCSPVPRSLNDKTTAHESPDRAAFTSLERVTAFEQWRHESNISVKPSAKPPSRADFAVSVEAASLKPMILQSNANVPSWMEFTSRYETARRSWMNGSHNMKEDWFPVVPNSGVYGLPTQRPPSRNQVTSWHQKCSKRPLSSAQSSRTETKRVKRVALDSAAKSTTAAWMTRDNIQNTEASTDVDGTGACALDDPIVEEMDPTSPRPQFSLAHSRDIGFEAGNRSSSKKGKLDRVTIKSAGVCFKPFDELDGKLGQGEAPSRSAGPTLTEGSSSSDQPLDGMANQGGRLQVEAGGFLKAKTRPTQSRSQYVKDMSGDRVAPLSDAAYLPTPLTVLAVEVHVQCRTGKAGVNDSRDIAMTPDSARDRVVAVVYVYARDPGGGDPLEFLERGCIFVPVERELAAGHGQDEAKERLRQIKNALCMSMPASTMGVTSPLSAECVGDEKALLIRFSAIVRNKDPDMLLSWDTQGAGLGYLIERGETISKSVVRAMEGQASRQKPPQLDMTRLLGRIPTVRSGPKPQVLEQVFNNKQESTELPIESEQATGNKEDAKGITRWKGSGLGRDWDESIGAGVAAASITGRLVFAGWKIVAEEVKHPNVSYLPAVVSTIINKRIPHHDNIKLTQWYGQDRGRERWRVIHHRFVQAVSSLLIFDTLDVIGRAGEAARLSGVEFSQSFPGIRGSQYKVEGVLLRALQSLDSEERGSKKGRRNAGNQGMSAVSSTSAETASQTQSPYRARGRCTSKTETDSMPNQYFFFSASKTDADKQEALEVQALTLEPVSGHVQDPVVVCDFTALYPSLMIAYNLCYSTIAGRLSYHTTRSEMRMSGETTGKVGPFVYPESRTATVLKHHLKSLNGSGGEEDRVYVAPTGSIYVSESVAKGVLPQVLDEILSTRAMLKKASKQYKKMVPDLSPSILRQLEARQLALKMVANVTYGYTSATFSGRCAMPLLADSIVECGRRTLMRAIELATNWGQDVGGRWHNCKVIYGDTDSVFIQLPGRSVAEAFQFGEEFCASVTALNPPPVQLKLEKVYDGSIMQTKKKYCGMKYESREQRKPSFEAKGIETVRRDQCALTQKILRDALVTLFRDGVSAVKTYLHRQWARILSGNIPVSDCILTGRVRSRYRDGVGPVQASLIRRLSEADPGIVVRNKERVAFVIVATPGTTCRLKDCVLTPMELLEQWDSYTINAAYYITKHVNAALQRCLGLQPHNINVDQWYKECPKPRRRIHFWPVTRSGSSLLISSYFGSDLCSICGKKCKSQGRLRASVCAYCRKGNVPALVTAMNKLNITQRAASSLAKRCRDCNLCFEDASTFAALKDDKNSRSAILARPNQSHGVVTPLANCSCIDCPTTFDRHRLREAEIEALTILETFETDDV